MPHQALFSSARLPGFKLEGKAALSINGLHFAPITNTSTVQAEPSKLTAYLAWIQRHEPRR